MNDHLDHTLLQNACLSGPRSRPLWHGLTLLIAVAFAWQSYAGQAAELQRVQGQEQRVNCRAIVEQVQRTSNRTAQREKTIPAKRLERAASSTCVALRTSPFTDAEHSTLLREGLLDLPPPG
jgi:hypothetical protein